MPTYKFSRRAEADLEIIIRYTLDNWGAKQIDSLETTLARHPGQDA
jgi:plasmid stabilization system protein ParE